MRVNRKRILKRLDDSKSDRKATTLYLSGELMKAFKKACGAHAPSSVIEEMIREFLDQTS